MRNERINYYNYFTEIEEHFVRRRGKHLLVSPMDWGLIAAWKDAGIPLQVALRGIDTAMDGFFSRQRRGSAKINSLCYCHDSVMAEYDAYRESRIGESESDQESRCENGEKAASGDPAGEAEISESIRYVSELVRDIKTLPEREHLSESAEEGLSRVQERLEAILQQMNPDGHADLESLERDLGMTDAILVETLLTAVPEDRRTEWEKEARAELKVYRKKLPKEMYSKIHDNFISGKVHNIFDIREFSLFRL